MHTTVYSYRLTGTCTVDEVRVTGKMKVTNVAAASASARDKNPVEFIVVFSAGQKVSG